MNMVKNLNMEKDLEDRIKGIIDQEKQENANGFDTEDAMKKLGDLFGEDNFIFDIVKDVTNQINSDDIGDEPASAINMLFGGGGKKLQELLASVGDKMEQKIKSGELTAEKLQYDAQRTKAKFEQMLPNFGGNDQSNHFDPTKMMEKFIGNQFTTLLSKEEQKQYNDVY